MGIQFKQVTKRYGGQGAPMVVRGIDFVVPKGSLTTILGPSGCGKTTTLRMIAGLESPTSGQIVIDGVDVTHLGPSERNVSMVFQSYALFPHMSVVDNVRYGLDVSGVHKTQALERAHKSLALVGLSGYEARFPSELSGGQQQRVALARALVLEPSVLLFDEPLSNLDARLRRAMRDEIRHLQQRLGLTVAYVTHDQSEALAVSDQIIVMEAGRIAQAGTPQDLYERPACAFVAGFMGEAVLLDGQSHADGSVQLGPLHLVPSQKVAVGAVRAAVRPEAWQVGRECLTGERLPGCLPATLKQWAYLGSSVELSFDTEMGMVFVVSPEADRHWRTGQVLALSLPGRGVSVVAVQAGKQP
jgi:iron(III) transport system ATP-binding protein